MRTLLLCTFLAATLLLTRAGAARQPAGELDETFGSGGIVTVDFGTAHDAGNALALQPDGKIIVAGSIFDELSGLYGDIALVRLLPDGSLDGSFGVAGQMVLDIGGRHDAAYALALQSDGKIVVAGSSYGGGGGGNDTHVAVLRFHADGMLDLSFGGDGIVMTPISGSDIALAVAVQPDGKIIAAGVAEQNGEGDVFLLRHNPDGSLDSSFAGDGVVQLDLGSSFDRATAVAVQADGKIVAAGQAYNATDADFALMRFQSNGILDTSFDGDGIVITDIDQMQNRANSLALQPDGKLVVAGYSHLTFGSDGIFTLARYNGDGALDAGFDGDGIVMTPVGGADVGRGVTLQPDGKILLVGDTWNGSHIDMALLRYQTDGSLDPDFGVGGVVTTDIDGENNGASSVAVQPDGKIVVAGSVFVSNYNENMVVARYLGDAFMGDHFVYLPLIQR